VVSRDQIENSSASLKTVKLIHNKFEAEIIVTVEEGKEGEVVYDGLP